MNREGASAAAKKWATEQPHRQGLFNWIENNSLGRYATDEIVDYAAEWATNGYDAGVAAEREAILREIEEIEAAGIRPTDPQGFFLSGHDAMDTLKRRILSRKEGA